MNDIISVATFIDSNMKAWIKNNPDNKSEKDCVSHVVGLLMKVSKGCLNPFVVASMVKLHRLPMEKAGFALEC